MTASLYRLVCDEAGLLDGSLDRDETTEPFENHSGFALRPQPIRAHRIISDRVRAGFEPRVLDR